MAYIKTTWKDRLVERPNTFDVVENPDGSITLIPKTGVVTDAGTPVNAANLNKLEDGIVNLENATAAHLAEKATKQEVNLKADKTYVNTLTQSIASGSPKGVYDTFNALKTARPDGDSNIYVVAENGNWYYWNDSVWTAGGVYQGTAVGENTVGFSNLKEDVKYSFDYDKTALKYGYKRTKVEVWELGAIEGATGLNEASTLRMRTKNYVIATEPILLYLKDINYNYYYIKYELDGTRIGSTSWSSVDKVFLSEGYKYRIVVAKKNNSVLTISDCENINNILLLLEGKSEVLTTKDTNNFMDILSNTPFVYGKRKLHNEWARGTINIGVPATNILYRIYTPNFIVPESDIFVKINEGYRYLVNNYDLAENYLNSSGWLTTNSSIQYDANKKYRIVLARITDNTSEIVDVEDFSKNIMILDGEFRVEHDMLSEELKKKTNAVYLDILGNGKKYIGITCRMGASIQNTLEAIQMTKLAGGYGVEMDVRPTSDNNIVLCHSAKIGDVTNETAGKYVYEYTVAEIKEFNMLDNSNLYPYSVKMPTLDEALDRCFEYGLVPFIDIKGDPGTYEANNQTIILDLIIDKIKNHNMTNQVVLISTLESSLQYLRNKLPNTILSVKRYIEETTVESDIAIAESVGGNILMQPEPRGGTFIDGVFTQERIEAYHRKGYPVKDIDFIYTFDPINEFRPQTRYWIEVFSNDRGGVWQILSKSPNLENVTAETLFVGDYHRLKISIGNLPKILISQLKPAILIDGQINPYIKVNAGYDSYSSDGIVCTFNFGSNVATLGNEGTLPTPVRFKINLLF